MHKLKTRISVVLALIVVSFSLAIWNFFNLIMVAPYPLEFVSDLLTKKTGNFYIFELSGFDMVYIATFPIWMALFFHKFIMRSWYNLALNYLLAYLCFFFFLILGMLIAPLFFVHTNLESGLLPQEIYSKPFDFYWTILFFLSFLIALNVNSLLFNRMFPINSNTFDLNEIDAQQ